VEAGQLRHQFRFERDTGTDDAATGQHNESWVLVCTRWGDAIPAYRSRQMAALKAVYPGSPYAITLRYDGASGILPGQRATQLDIGKVFDVIGSPVDPDAKRREMLVPVSERGVLRPVAP
jgi:head-tail adaptor